MAERHSAERTYAPNTNDRMDIWLKDIRTKRQIAERQIVEKYGETYF